MPEPRLFNLQITATDALNQSASKNVLVAIAPKILSQALIYPIDSLVTSLNFISLVSDASDADGALLLPDELITTQISPIYPAPTSLSDNLVSTHISASNMKLMPFPGAGNIICTNNAPVVGAGKAFEFTRYGDFLINVDVKSGVQITNDTLNSDRGSPIIAHQWTQLPNAAPLGGTQVGKIEPRCASLPQIGGSFYISVTAANRWLILAARHPTGQGDGLSDNYYYDVPYIAPAASGNGLTIVGF